VQPIEVNEDTAMLAVEQEKVDVDSNDSPSAAPVAVPVSGQSSDSVTLSDDIPNSADPLREKAERGDAESQFALAMRYFEGDGVPQSDAEATKWIRRAAAQGHKSASNLLNAMTRKDNVVVEVPVDTGRDNSSPPALSTCSMCRGTGLSSSACPMCQGSGLDRSTGKTACFACDGKRFQRCPHCLGSGTTGLR
jgi:TPR repeat protein